MATISGKVLLTLSIGIVSLHEATAARISRKRSNPTASFESAGVNVSEQGIPGGALHESTVVSVMRNRWPRSSSFGLANSNESHGVVAARLGATTPRGKTNRVLRRVHWPTAEFYVVAGADRTRSIRLAKVGLSALGVHDLVPVISGSLLAVVIAAWAYGRWAWGTAEASGSDGKTSSSGEKAGNDGPVRWLGTLAVATFAMLFFQLALSYLSGSLTLLADMGHASGDSVTYLAAYCAEKVKRDLARRDAAPGLVSSLDTVAGVTSTLLVAFLTFAAMLNAVQQLRSQTPGLQLPGQNPEEENAIPVGEAILGFAIVSLAANVGLLVLRFQMGAAEQQPPAKKPSAPAPPKLGRMWVPRALPGQCMAAPKDPQPMERPTMSSAKMLHAILHPGCGGPGAGCGGGQSSESETANAGKGGKCESEKNMNLLGVTLHLATDVVRSFIVLVAGLLLQFGVLTDVVKTDAVCAIVVGVCVLLGSAAFFIVRKL